MPEELGLGLREIRNRPTPPIERTAKGAAAHQHSVMRLIGALEMSSWHFLLLSGLIGGCTALNASLQPVGTYQRCPIHCETLVIKADHTFELIVKGDIYDHVTTGQWKQDGEFITLSGPNPCDYPLEEFLKPDLEGTEISVRWDGSEGPLDFELGASDGNNTASTLAAVESKIVLPIQKPIQVQAAGFWIGNCLWDVKQRGSNSFIITLKALRGPPVGHQRFLLRPSGIISVGSEELERKH